MVTFAEPPSLKEETTNYNQGIGRLWASFRSSEWKMKKRHRPTRVAQALSRTRGDTSSDCQLPELRNFHSKASRSCDPCFRQGQAKGVTGH